MKGTIPALHSVALFAGLIVAIGCGDSGGDPELAEPNRVPARRESAVLESVPSPGAAAFDVAVDRDARRAVVGTLCDSFRGSLGSVSRLPVRTPVSTAG